MLRGWKMYSVTPSITTNIATYFRMLIVMQNSGIPEIENSLWYADNENKEKCLQSESSV